MTTWRRREEERRGKTKRKRSEYDYEDQEGGTDPCSHFVQIGVVMAAAMTNTAALCQALGIAICADYRGRSHVFTVEREGVHMITTWGSTVEESFNNLAE